MSTTNRSMYMSDLAQVLEIINSHDDDDGEAAEQEFSDQGTDHHYVCVEDKSDAVLGVSGFRPIDGCDQTAWLSWTYLDKAAIGKGLGKKLLGHVIQVMKDAEMRIVFVKVSDYNDPQHGDIYAAALRLYKHLGFTTELISEDFYDEGESQTILSLTLSDTQSDDVEVADEKPVIRFNGMYEIAETDGAYTFNWTVEKSAGLFGKRSFSTEDLQVGLDAVIADDGRKVFLTFPSNLVLIHRPLQSVGFKYIGKLSNYYEHGLHELHFVHDLKPLL